MSKDITTAGPSRRSIAKGAAWAVPAVSVAAAAPSLAASTDECTDCAAPILGAAVTAIRNTNLTGTIRRATIAAGVTFSLTGCTGLVSAGVVTLESATLTISRERGAPTTHTANVDLGLGVAAAGIVVLPNAIVFEGVEMPNGLYAGVSGLGATPAWPSQLCLNIRYFRLVGGVPTECSTQVCYTPSLAEATLGTIPGTVTFATVWA